MGIFPGKSKISRAFASVLDVRAFLGSLPRTILYRGGLAMLLACTMICARVAVAQEERPQITPGERKVPRKKEAGPRALAIVQLTANGKATLIPVTILVNGKFYDATAYKANPIPMALESGTVYEGEHTGNSLGLFTVGSALHSNSVAVQSPWLGTGMWRPAGAEIANKPHAAESVPVGIDTSDGPPRLSKGGSGSNPAAPASSAPSSSTSPTAPSSPTSAPPSGDEPPRLSKGSPPQSGTDGSSGSSQSAPSSPAPKVADTKPSDAKTSDAKPTDSKADARAQTPASDSGAGEGNRPRLRRGKPTEALPEDEIPGYSKPGAAPAANTGRIAEVKAATGPVQLIPAISDASGPEPRSYVFEWLKMEEGERREAMTALAKEQVRAYLVAQAKAQISAKPAAAKGAHASVKKGPEPILENAQMIAYDLWGTNQPVFVFAADAHLPPVAAGTAHATTDPGMQYTIMLVARTDIYNKLHTLYSGVTDKFHLDITPRLELIDAVDVDGDGRGELLFKEISDAGTGWVIYRASADKLWKLFDSLNPE
jgi:hypothetical protein